MVLTEGSSIQFRDAKMYLQNADETVNHLKKLKEARNQFEVNFIKSVIIECKGDLTKAAKILDITKRQLNNKILDYNLREWISSLCE